MSALVFVLVLVIALLGLYLLSDYTGYEEPSSSSEEAASSGWNNSDPGGWYYDGGTGDGDGDGDGNGQYDQQIIQTGGGGGYGEDGIKTAVFVELIDDETERRIPEAGVRFELYRTDTTHLMNGSLQTLNTYYPEKINYREYETTEEGTFYLPEKIWQGSYYFHELSEPEGYDAADDTYYDVERMYYCNRIHITEDVLHCYRQVRSGANRGRYAAKTVYDPKWMSVFEMTEYMAKLYHDEAVSAACRIHEVREAGIVLRSMEAAGYHGADYVRLKGILHRGAHLFYQDPNSGYSQKLSVFLSCISPKLEWVIWKLRNRK
ncbi:hypothetical protein CGS59_07275 [Faecalibacterium prausnitzii]|uniref:SpaA-like prealbumin fold domain-containing protein n=2 Tax=Faecalibacterium prausnitzii TaxID=853 RepID=A0A2A7AYT9_9FIRM|nr:hypothetical protein CGS59_07275 [Faecalibacterium prausnitzii]